MIKNQTLPHAFWLEVVMCIIYVLNKFPNKALQTITPYEAWHDIKSFISHVHAQWPIDIWSLQG